MWRADEITFDFADDMTLHPVVTAVVMTPGGTLRFMAEPEVKGSKLVLHGVHAQDAKANAVGPGNLMVVARALMERMGFDGLEVEGAVRTSGASPGRQPRCIRFTRRLRPSPATGTHNNQND